MIHFSAWIARRWEGSAFKGRFLSSAREHYWQEQIERLRCNGKECNTERPIRTAEQ
jgi:hypothetical protein